MDSATRVQVLKEVVCIYPWERCESTYFPASHGQMLRKTGLYNLNSEFKPLQNLERDGLHMVIPVQDILRSTSPTNKPGYRNRLQSKILKLYTFNIRLSKKKHISFSFFLAQCMFSGISNTPLSYWEIVSDRLCFCVTAACILAKVNTRNFNCSW